MHRMAWFFFLLLFTNNLVEAATQYRHYKITWRERDGVIDFSTVCENYGYGSVDYRGCRQQAQRHFKQKCAEYTQKVDDSGGATRARYRRSAETFCHAASQFTPVN